MRVNWWCILFFLPIVAYWLPFLGRDNGIVFDTMSFNPLVLLYLIPLILVWKWLTPRQKKTVLYIALWEGCWELWFEFIFGWWLKWYNLFPEMTDPLQVLQQLGIWGIHFFFSSIPITLLLFAAEKTRYVDEYQVHILLFTMFYGMGADAAFLGFTTVVTFMVWFLLRLGTYVVYIYHR